MSKTFEQIVERLRAIDAPGILATLDPAQASRPDPLAAPAPAHGAAPAKKPEGAQATPPAAAEPGAEAKSAVETKPAVESKPPSEAKPASPAPASAPAAAKPAPPAAKERPKGPFGDRHLFVEPKSIRGLLRILRDDPELRFEILADLTGVDYDAKAPNLGVIYCLLSVTHKHRLVLRADVPKADPAIDSVVEVHPGANWHEREAKEMLGLVFRGHPDPRNILLGDDWEGHPLRKDYEFPVEYHGISAV